jgi:preprotein translocase subunit YajC
MADPRILLGLGAQSSGEPPAFASLALMGLIFAIFYFILIMPMKSKQKKAEEMIKGLKTGDKVIINPGIFGTIVAVEDDSFQVRVDDKARLKVLKSAGSGLQGPNPTTEKK